jgi:hypothetical protein
VLNPITKLLMNDSEFIIRLIREYCANPDDLAKIASAIEAIQDGLLPEKQEKEVPISHIYQLTQGDEGDVEYAERMRAEYPDAEGLNY